MQRQIFAIIAIAITAASLLGVQAAQAVTVRNTFNVTVNCNNGQQAHKQLSSSSINNVNINVNCTSGGNGTGGVGPQGPQGIQGIPGPAGAPGQNATVLIITQNTTVTPPPTNGTTPTPIPVPTNTTGNITALPPLVH